MRSTDEHGRPKETKKEEEEEERRGCSTTNQCARCHVPLCCRPPHRIEDGNAHDGDECNTDEDGDGGDVSCFVKWHSTVGILKKRAPRPHKRKKPQEPEDAL